jgi:glutathione synthase/RimK-type ligase-like ATP-grasp enzyme
VTRLENDPGRILSSRQWFLGWQETLRELSAWASRDQLAERWLCPPEDVLMMFDKAACQSSLETAELAVPPSLGLPVSFDDLWERMRATGCRRIFLKPCHGSSASGVVALEASRHGIQAFTTVERVETSGEIRLYNRRSIQAYRGAAEVRALVDSICPERCLAQVWVPKAGLAGKVFDVRVVVIGGRARHVMVRLGNGPMTNSALLGGKADASSLRARMGEDAWAGMLGLCERAMVELFPRSLYAGIDVLVEPDFRTSRILEVNAFGDLLPRHLHEGQDTYAWEVEQALERDSAAQVSAIGS